MTNSREKGAQFERDVCTKIGKWWGCSFKRTTMMAHGQTKTGLYGDICAINPHRRFPFCVECKADEWWDIEVTISNPLTSELSRRLQQCWVEADRTNGLIPLAILKHNFKPPLIVTTPDVLSGLIQSRALIHFEISPHRDQWGEIFTFQDLLTIDPQTLIRTLDNERQ